MDTAKAISAVKSAKHLKQLKQRNVNRIIKGGHVFTGFSFMSLDATDTSKTDKNPV
jgi:hypothetical protein